MTRRPITKFLETAVLAGSSALRRGRAVQTALNVMPSEDVFAGEMGFAKSV